MNKYLREYIKLSKYMFLDEVIENNNFSICFSKADNRVFWNGIFNINIFYLETHLLYIEDLFSNRSLRTSFFVDIENKNIINFLLSKDYKIQKTDYWMIKKIQNKYKFELQRGIKIVKVNNETSVNDFISIFLSTWEDPNLTFSRTIKEKLLKKDFLKYSSAYILYYKNIPASALGYIEDGNTGILHSVATVPRFRQRGFGTILCKYTLNRVTSQEVILRSEINGDGISIYQKLGFSELGKTYIISKFQYSDFIIFQKLKKLKYVFFKVLFYK